MYRYDQLLILIVLSTTLTFLVGSVFFSVLNWVLQTTISKKEAHFKNIIVNQFKSAFFVIYGCIVLFFLFQSAIRELSINTNLLNIFFLILTVIVWKGVQKTGFILFNIPIIVVALVACFQWGISYSYSASRSKDNSWYIDSKSETENLKFKNLPNVYYIILESYLSSNTLKLIYNFDNSSFEEHLNDSKFDIFENCYSNYRNTLTSLSSTFAMQHHYYSISKGKQDAIGARELIGGLIYNPVLDVFKNNGYQIQYLFNSDYAFIAGNKINYATPKRTRLKVFEIFQNNMLDDFFKLFSKSYQQRNKKGKDILALDTEVFYDEINSRVIVAANSKSPYFTVVKLGLPGHFGKKWNEIDKNKLTQYPKKIIKTNTITKIMVDHIIEIDPNAYIVLIGDHGTFRYRGAWYGDKDKNENMRKNNILPALVAKDVFHTFLAIRCPNNDIKKSEIHSHVNLFRHVFSHLTMDSSFIKTKSKDVSYFDKETITVRDGKPLDNWIVEK